MCKWNGEWKHYKSITINGKLCSIDSCMVPLVTALNCAGLETIACCCGHGKQPASVILKDGREVLIMPDFKSARKVCALFPTINPR